MINPAIEALTSLVARMGGMPDCISEAGLERYIAARIAAASPISARRERVGSVSREGSIAVFNVRGVIAPKAEYYDEVSSFALAEALDAAAADPEVTAGVLDLETPGGYSLGMIELADAAKRFAAVKPLIAQVSLQCCSAGYWLASQATKIYAGPRDDVGSIGVRSGIIDWSGMFKNLGLEKISIATGPLKAIGDFGAPVTEAHRAFIQERVDMCMQDFKAAVMTGRGFSDEHFASVATGGWWTGAQALELKLIDGIQTMKETLAGLSTGGSKVSSKTRSMKMENEPDAPKAATHKQLKAALPEASAEFILAQLDASATEVDAIKAYNAHLASELKKANDAKAAAEKEADDAKKAAATSSAKGATGSKTVAGLGEGGAAGGSQSASTAIDYWEEARAYQKANNCRWSEACLAIKRRYPEAREAMGAPPKVEK